MIYLGVFASAVITGTITAWALWLYGVHHTGVMLACAVVAGGIEMAALIAWYLAWSAGPRADGLNES